MFLFCFFIFDLIVLSWTQVSFVHIGNEYVIDNKTLSYSSARNACESINSTLVDFNDGNRNILVDKIRENFTGSVTRFWIKSNNSTVKKELSPIFLEINIETTYQNCLVLEVHSKSEKNYVKLVITPCDIYSNEIESLPGFICQKPESLEINSTTKNEEISPTTTRFTATSDVIHSKTSLTTSSTTRQTLFFKPCYPLNVIALSTGYVLLFLLVLIF